MAQYFRLLSLDYALAVLYNITFLGDPFVR